MAEVICNTSPLQYLYQAGCLYLLPQLAGRIFVPPAVVEELVAGIQAGVALPDLSQLDWIQIRQPASLAVLALVRDLGPGESQVLALALELPQPLVILDDLLARRVAAALHLPLTGTLGVLLSAKRRGLIKAIAPILDKFQALQFRLSPQTRAAVLALVGEEDRQGG